MTSNAQLEIPLAPPAIAPEDLDAFCSWLAGRGWISARQIEAACGLCDRTVRAYAEQSDGRILSGQRGYRLNDATATPDEVAHSSGWLIAQGKKMIRRGLAQQRVHHRQLHQRA